MEPAFTLSQFKAALRHATNYHSVDAKLDMADFKLVELLAPEIEKHLQGKTDVQVYERMSPSERLAIGTQLSNDVNT